MAFNSEKADFLLALLLMLVTPWGLFAFFWFWRCELPEVCYLSTAWMVWMIGVGMKREQGPWIQRKFAHSTCSSVSRVRKTTQKSIICYLVC